MEETKAAPAFLHLAEALYMSLQEGIVGTWPRATA